MTETEMKDINRFSWQRVRKFAGLYCPALRNRIIIYTLIEALLVIVTSVFPNEEVILGACCIIWLMSLAIPFVFILRDDTIVRLAPVKASERLTFYLLWILLLFPLLMGVIQWLFMYIGSLLEPNGMMNFVITNLKESYSILSVTSVVFMYTASTLYGIALYILITDAAITCRRHPHIVIRIAYCIGYHRICTPERYYRHSLCNVRPAAISSRNGKNGVMHHRNARPHQPADRYRLSASPI